MGDVIITGAGPNIPSTEVGLAERQNPAPGKGRDGVGVSIAISLSQDARSMAVWRLQVYAQTNEGKRLVGEFTTRPPAAGDPPSRVVAFASCPGAFDWRVVPFGPAPTVGAQGQSVAETCEITIATTELSIAGAGIVDIVPVNGTRRIGIVHPAPQFLAGQGVLSTGPGQLFTFKGFVDPAQALSFIGVVDKATPVVNGDAFLDVPIELPLGSTNFIDSWPDGLPFGAQIRWAISTTQNPITLGPVASVGARRT